MKDLQEVEPQEDDDTLPASSLILQETKPLSSNLDQAVDILAMVLRDLGTYAFDLNDRDAPQITALFNAWAQHVLYATPTPDLPPTATENGRRDWVGLHRFVHTHRRQEHDYITRTLSGIRAIIPQTMAGLHCLLSGSEVADRKIQAQMQTLQQAAEEGSMESLRREAFQVIAAVGQIIEERQQRHEEEIEALRGQLHDLNQQLKQARAESTLDPLTRLDNRKAFDTHLEQTLELQQSFQTPSCLLLIDADRFKRINDTYGHAVGDVVLKTLANCLTRTFVSQEDCVARYGGEEFAVILREATAEDARRLMERLMSQVRATRVEAGNQTVCFTVSAGIAALQPGEDAASWLARADEALYRAKQTGRDRFLMV